MTPLWLALGRPLTRSMTMWNFWMKSSINTLSQRTMLSSLHASRKFKKDVDWIVYIRCDRERKASLNSASFERRIHSDTRLMKCSFSVVDKWNNKSYSEEWSRDEIEISHEQEMKSSEMNVLSHSLSFKRMQTCLQRFICSEEDAETAILKLF